MYLNRMEVLSLAEIEQIHDATMGILENVGVEVGYGPLARKVRSSGLRHHARGGRVALRMPWGPEAL